MDISKDHGRYLKRKKRYISIKLCTFYRRFRNDFFPLYTANLHWSSAAMHAGAGVPPGPGPPASLGHTGVGRAPSGCLAERCGLTDTSSYMGFLFKQKDKDLCRGFVFCLPRTGRPARASLPSCVFPAGSFQYLFLCRHRHDHRDAATCGGPAPPLAAP